MEKEGLLRILQENGGILNLILVFVPRRFGACGRRLRLHPDDYYALGTARGSIKERWFSSVICAMNGPEAAPDEGMSYVNVTGTAQGKVSLKDFVDALGPALIGEALYKKYGTWPMYSKFFDYEGPLFHHVHLDFAAAARVGKLGKPEAYYYPPQYNNYPGNFPHTYFGFDPDVTRDEVKQRLAGYLREDTRITELSRAYRIELGTGWYTPPGVIHAPGSFLTYEPQWNSDVNSVFENICQNEIYDKSFLNENCPPDRADDLDYIMDLLDWEKNVDPHYRKTYFRPPLTALETGACTEKCVAYGNDYIAAKELTVQPGQTVRVRDDTAYGCILTQGYGRIGQHRCAAAGMLRFGQTSEDEFFVSCQAAREGVVIENHSACEPLVMLKHFPSNENTPAAR
ncbi:MAG TPA: hypothetical protein H9915_07215 [Candidatus Gemmiger faecigallinarum]|nr:hypothetical protein [Candidatus Gemmiger faecigallinarum]